MSAQNSFRTNLANKSDSPQRKPASLWKLGGIAASFLVTTMVFAWCVSQSFSVIQNDQAIDASNVSHSTVAGSKVHDVEQILFEAKQMDDLLLRQRDELVDSRYQHGLPDATVARKNWKKQVLKLETQLKGTKVAKKGTVLWGLQQRLRSMHEDAPLSEFDLHHVGK